MSNPSNPNNTSSSKGRNILKMSKHQNQNILTNGSIQIQNSNGNNSRGNNQGDVNQRQNSSENNIGSNNRGSNQGDANERQNSSEIKIGSNNSNQFNNNNNGPSILHNYSQLFQNY